MGEAEVIERLQEHLNAKKKQRGELCRNDKFYCRAYVMDFLNLTRKQAEQFIKINFPAIADFK